MRHAIFGSRGRGRFRGLGGFGVLGGPMDAVKQAFSMPRLKAVGWAGAGGAAGGLYNRLVVPQLRKLPVLDNAPEWAHSLLGALIVANASWKWNSNFAAGAAGKLAGDAFTGVLDKLGLFKAAGLGYFGQLPSDLAPITDVDAFTPMSALSEVIPQGGIGAFGANLDPLSMQPSIQSTFEPNLAFLS